MKRGCLGHRKVKRLCRALGVPLYAGLGILEAIFQLTATQCPRGNLGALTAAEIADELGWQGSPEGLEQALIETGWLDPCPCHRVRIHDWPEHCDQTVRRREEVKRDGFLRCYEQDASSKLAPDEQQTSQPPPPPPPPPTPTPEEKSPNASRSVPPRVLSPPARQRAVNGKSLMPDRLEPADAERLKRLARPLGLTDDQLRHAARVVRDWSHGNGKARRDWVLVIINGIRAGWALKGYKPPTGPFTAHSSPGWDLPKEAADGA